MKTIVIKLSACEKDINLLADKIEFLFDDNKCCFILRVYWKNDVDSFIFDEIEFFSIC